MTNICLVRGWFYGVMDLIWDFIGRGAVHRFACWNEAFGWVYDMPFHTPFSTRYLNLGIGCCRLVPNVRYSLLRRLPISRYCPARPISPALYHNLELIQIKIIMKSYLFPLLFFGLLFTVACEETDTPISAPATYSFLRDGQSTVSFSGQTTRIQMATELINQMQDFNTATEASMLEMYRNETATGEDADPFSNADLNASTKSIKSKVAASADFFSANTAAAATIKAEFETWIAAQVSDVIPNENVLAAPGVAGQIADGSSVRFVNEMGLEYNQAVNKSLIGALMIDQTLNNYLSSTVLDEADNRTNNDAGTVEDGQSYTTMEHKWDEAYGYLYGLSADPANPNATLGDDEFLNKYIGRVEGDPDFAGIAAEIYDAFKLGRAAIVAKDYALRDDQAAIIREKVSEIIGIRAVYYLMQAKTVLEQSTPAYGTAFHDLSEGYGFIYSLQFTRKPDTSSPYFTQTEVAGFLADLLGDGTHGLWDVEAATLEQVATTIAAKFDFTLEQASN